MAGIDCLRQEYYPRQPVHYSRTTLPLLANRQASGFSRMLVMKLNRVRSPSVRVPRVLPPPRLLPPADLAKLPFPDTIGIGQVLHDPRGGLCNPR